MTKIRLKPYTSFNNYINYIHINMFGDPSQVIEAIAAARRGDALKSREQLEREKKNVKQRVSSTYNKAAIT